MVPIVVKHTEHFAWLLISEIVFSHLWDQHDRQQINNTCFAMYTDMKETPVWPLIV